MNHSLLERCWRRVGLFIRLVALIFTCLAALVLPSDASAQSGTRIIYLGGNLNFGDVAFGTSAQRTLMIFNLGNSVLTVSNIFGPPQPVSLLGGFSADWSGSIYPGYGQEITVTFAPGGSTVLNNTKPVDYSGFLDVVSDATGGSNSIPVSGVGVLPQFVTRIISVNTNLNFGQTKIWGSKSFVLTVSNSGNGDLTISNINLPDGFRAFWGGSNLTVPTGSRANVSVVFAPTNVMPYGGTATIVSDATKGKGEFTVSGDGAYPTGHYIGLFSPAVPNVAFDNSGYFSITAGANGAFSGYLLFAGGRQPFSGRLSQSGFFSGMVAQTGGSNLDMFLSLTPGYCVGGISDATWWADLSASRVPAMRTLRSPGMGVPRSFSLELPPGKYRFQIAGSTDPLQGPTNNGVGTLRLNEFGAAHLSGTLPDGTPFSQDTTLVDSQLPLYTSLYNHQGAVLGWVRCQIVPTNRPFPQVILLTNNLPFTNYPFATTNTSLTITNIPVILFSNLPPVTNIAPFTNFPPLTNILVLTNYPPFTNFVFTNFPPVTNIAVIIWDPPAVPPMLPPGPTIPGLLEEPRGHPFPGVPPNFPGTNRISGSINWFKPAQIDSNYPDGLSFQTTINGPTE